MTVLLQYNDGDSFTVAELQRNTELSSVSNDGFIMFVFVSVMSTRLFKTTKAFRSRPRLI